MLGESVFGLDWKGNLVLLVAALAWLGFGFYEGVVYWFPVVLLVWALFALAVTGYGAWDERQRKERRKRRAASGGGAPSVVADFDDDDDDEQDDDEVRA